uniref:Uncharacterized protein n=1 Tax=Mycoplasma anserisalpingitidis TaxID=519450 RepID=A0A8F2E4W9_9MOLU|nr:hypothetical protein [Mycoplasma anserisalpingitidis]
MANIFNKAKNFFTAKQEDSLWNIFNKPNFRSQLAKYGGGITALTIFSKKPKISIEDQELSKLWNSFENENNLLYSLSIIEELLYEEGRIAVGFEENKETGIPNLIFGKILKVERDNNKISLMHLHLYNNFDFNQNVVTRIYDLNDENFYTLTMTKSKNSNKERLHNDISKYTFIPLVIFENLPKGKSDLDLVNQELYDLINLDLELLFRDGYTSMPWIFHSDTLLNEYGKLNFYDLDKRVIPQNTLNQVYTDRPIELLQPNPQSGYILQRLEKNLNLVRELAFLKQTTGTMGTKNLHSDEVNALSSNFDSFIEFKANLREHSLKKLVLMFFNFLNKKVDEAIIDVEVCGSTKYLQNSQNLKIVKSSGDISPELLKIKNTAPNIKLAEEYDYESDAD